MRKKRLLDKIYLTGVVLRTSIKMAILQILLLTWRLFASDVEKLDYPLGEPRFNSCGNLSEAELCEEDCTDLYSECVGSCTNEGQKSPSTHL